MRWGTVVAPRRGPVVVLLACLVTLGAGYGLKRTCTQVPWDGRQYGELCYNDIQPLYLNRGVDRHVFPYVHGRLDDGELVGGAIEYPVLTGTFMWATGYMVDDWRDYLSFSAALLAPFALLTAFLLERLSGIRALLFAASPALVLYAFHNWDLLVVAAAIGAIWAWSRGKPTFAGALLGLGAALKLYPLFFLAPLFLDTLRRRGLRSAAASVGAGVATVVAANLPFILASPGGWLATYEFHSQRVADFNAIYTWGLEWLAFDPPKLNLVSSGLTTLFWVVALLVGWRRAPDAGEYPFVQVCAAMLVSFLLWSKVHSPQYALWLIPFFALLCVHWGWWVAYSIADLAVYVGIFRWFYDFSQSQDQETWTWAKRLLVAGVWGRAAVLLVLFVVFLGSRRAEVGRATAFVSQVPLTVLKREGAT